MSKRIELTGQRFGRWTVLGYSGMTKAGAGGAWFCQCDCGTERVVSSQALRRGRTHSCGCANAAALGARHFIHGHCSRAKKSRTYRIWRHLIRRCCSPSEHNFKWYGAKGVKVCRRWRTFVNFLADMGECPEGLVIGRKNHTKNYQPDNCQWITKRENSIEVHRGYRPPGWSSII